MLKMKFLKVTRERCQFVHEQKNQTLKPQKNTVRVVQVQENKNFKTVQKIVFKCSRAKKKSASDALKLC